MSRQEFVVIEVVVYYNCDECQSLMSICGETRRNEGLFIQYKCENRHYHESRVRYPRIEQKEIPIEAYLPGYNGV